MMYKKGDYVTTAINKIKVYRFLKDVMVGDPVKADQIESVHERIPKPMDGDLIIDELDGDYFFKRNWNGTVVFHAEDGWR